MNGDSRYDDLEFLKDMFEYIGQDTLSALLLCRRRSYSYVKKQQLVDDSKHIEIYHNVIIQGKIERDENVFDVVGRMYQLTASIIFELFLTGYIEIVTGYNNADLIKKEIARIMKNIHLIHFLKISKRLADDAVECMEKDDSVSSMEYKRSRAVKGDKGEDIIKAELERNGIEFFPETLLQAAGELKTPDFLLKRPIFIHDNIVNWIESKYLFGTELVMGGINKDQLVPYRNRFGYGMIIYWLGYVEEKKSVDGVITDTKLELSNNWSFVS
eukprot:GHVP01016116.1.p1 GENE.GHVP01016116.1~~GHVP01016116.1.p1  ORF type:complete len:286 (-),score=52.24 GHVP01016116.1:10-822(-)